MHRLQPGRRKRLYGLGLVGLGVGNIVLIFILLAFFRRLVRPLRRPRAHPCTLGRPRLVCTRNSNRGIRPHGRRTPPPRVETHKTSSTYQLCTPGQKFFTPPPLLPPSFPMFVERFKKKCENVCQLHEIPFLRNWLPLSPLPFPSLLFVWFWVFSLRITHAIDKVEGKSALFSEQN